MTEKLSKQEAATPAMPSSKQDYTVLDSGGAVVAEKVSFDCAFEALTEDRSRRGWVVIAPDNTQLRSMREMHEYKRALKEALPVQEPAGRAEPLIDAVDQLISMLDYGMTADQWIDEVKKLRAVRMSHLIRSQRKKTP
jgi:hypothetical protein